MNIRCVAIDDEPIALEIIRQFCTRMGGIELFMYSDPREGVEKISELKPDIVFLDIEMNDTTGLQIAKNLPEEICFIFTTAYMKYALDGFNLDAADFLHKPFSYDRFKEAIDKAVRRMNYITMLNGKKQIIVKQDYSNVPVMLSDILYIEAMENYSKIYVKNRKMILAHNSLKSISDMLPKACFLRIHKSYIVPRSEIQSFTRQSVSLSNGTVLPVGRQFSSSLFLK